MLKLNNKGFAVSTILYGILTLTILVLMLIFGIMRSGKSMNEGLVESLTESMNRCASLEVKLEKCYLNGTGDCGSIADSYNSCINNEDVVIPDDGTSSGTLLTDAVLINNEAYADNVSSTYVSSSSGIDFSKPSSNTNGRGLYYTSTNTRNGGTTFYFRGNVTNNWVVFGKTSAGKDIYWQIIRINEDGSTRMIYAGIGSPTVSSTGINNSYYHEDGTDNAHVGYMGGYPEADTLSYPTCIEYVAGANYASGEWNFYNAEACSALGNALTATNAYAATHLNLVDSTVKTNVDSWYSSVLSNYSRYLADAGFCNDRSLYTGIGVGTKETQYAAMGRLSSYYASTVQPQFACPNEESDLFTTSTSSIGNKALMYPVGLVTADEMVYAGGVYNDYESTTNYLFGNYWSMTPMLFVDGITGAGIFAELTVAEGIYGEFSAFETRAVRPVINLKATVTLTTTLPSGCTSLDGTASCPYIVDVD